MIDTMKNTTQFVDVQLNKLKQIINTDVTRFNEMMIKKNVPLIYIND
jgi:hypothetical protein